jgi:hypothetical protein
MEADLRGRSGEESVNVCGAFFGRLSVLIFIYLPLECISADVHKRSPQVSTLATDAKSTPTCVKLLGPIRARGEMMS